MTKILILGATGNIGSSVTRELVRRGHEVYGLARSPRAERVLAELGAFPLTGDLRAPDPWMAEIAAFHTLIHVAATFEDDMASVDNLLIESLDREVRRRGLDLRVIYTGGVWLYGDTAEAVKSEDDAFDPIGAFAWMVANARKLMENPLLTTAVIHPGMVYHRDGGVMREWVSAAKRGEPFEIFGNRDACWPLVHRDDLALLYAILAENRHLSGHFNATAEVGVPVLEITAAIAEALGTEHEYLVRPLDEVLAEEGDWAEGPALCQRVQSKRTAAVTEWKPQCRDFRQSDLFKALRGSRSSPG